MKKTYMILLAIFFSSLSMIAQEEKDENKGEKKEKEKKSISDLTESSNKIEGLFTIYQDSISGDLKMIVSKNQLGKEFIHFSQIADGVTDAGRFRGSYNDGTIFYIKKHFKIDKHNILGHSDIAPDRKLDPGEKFPWMLLSQN